jgi:hypothetical protein
VIIHFQSLSLLNKALSKNFLHTWLWYTELVASPHVVEFITFCT